MKRLAIIVGAVVIPGLAFAHWYFGDRGRFTTGAEYTGLTRTVSGNELSSDHDPAVKLRFGSDYRYIGGQKFVLYGVADTEQHFFVETNADGELESVYWIQFEAYLPGKPYSYNYDDSPLQVTLGDYTFQTDTDAFAFDPSRKRKRGTDGALAREFLASKGFVYPSEVAYARLVYLTDATRKKELMIIFMDDLSKYGIAAEGLEAGAGKAAGWPEAERAHLERVKETLRVVANGNHKISVL